MENQVLGITGKDKACYTLNRSHPLLCADHKFGSKHSGSPCIQLVLSNISNAASQVAQQ